MKKTIFLFLCIGICLCIIGCENKAEKLLNDAKSAFELENWDIVIDTATQLVETYPDADQVKVARKLIDEAEKNKAQEEHDAELAILISEMNKQYIEIAQWYKDNLREPESLKIYGDIVVMEYDGGANAEGSTVLSLKCDAKNGYGAYSGSDIVEIWLFPTGDMAAIDSDDSYFLDIRKSLKDQGKLDLSKNTSLNFITISGEAMAKILNVEYVE